MALFLLCLSWLVLTLFSLYLRQLLTTNRCRLPPGPWSLPIIGSLFELGDQPHRALARLAKRHGPLMSLRLGMVTTIVASSPDTAREILQKHDAALAARSVPDALRTVHAGSAVAWLPPNRKWRFLRKICTTQLFTAQRLDALQSLRREIVRDLLCYVSKLAAGGVPVDIGRVAFATNLNLLSRTIFSVDLVKLESDSSQEFKDVIAAIMETAGKPNVSDFFPAIAAADIQGARRNIEKLFARLHRVFDEQIEQRRRGRAAGERAENDFLDLLLDQECQCHEEGVEMDQDTIRALFADLFGAGSETSSSTVEWAMAELLQNPQPMVKVQEELARVIGSNREIEESDIGQLPYLQAVVKETLRLHPPVPFLLPHRAETIVEIKGYKIPEGANVIVNTWAIGRDSETWIEPEKFIPERFSEKGIDFRGRDFELIPFGAGRRICLGLPLAFRMVHLILGSLLHRFEWRLPKEVENTTGVDMTEKFGVTLVMAVPLRAMAMQI